MSTIEIQTKIEKLPEAMQNEVNDFVEFLLNKVNSGKKYLQQIKSDEILNEKKWYQTLHSNESFDFLNEPEEVIYSIKDGKPFHKK